MSALEKRYRRNFVVALLLHVALVGAVVSLDHFGAFANVPKSEIVPGVIIGISPAGNGPGLGHYKAPETKVDAGPTTPASGDSGDAGNPSDESTPAPTKAVVSKPAHNEVAIQTKAAKQKTASQAKPAAASSSDSGAKKTTAASSAKNATPSKGKPGAKGAGRSVDDIRGDFARALKSEPDGTSRGDGREAGGGHGGGPVGREWGVKDGVPTGVGQGTPYAGYLMHIRDALYEAWEQPGSALDKKLMTTVQLRIARDGSIAEAHVVVGSGNKSMDDSVLSAVHKVLRLDPPPDGLVTGQFAEIPVDFQVRG